MTDNERKEMWEAIRRLALAVEELGYAMGGGLGTATSEVLSVELAKVNAAVERNTQ